MRNALNVFTFILITAEQLRGVANGYTGSWYAYTFIRMYLWKQSSSWDILHMEWDYLYETSRQTAYQLLFR